MPDKAPWRQEIELLQNYPKHKTFTFTTSSGSAEDAVVLAGSMEEANKVSFVVELGAAYIEFDGDGIYAAWKTQNREPAFKDIGWGDVPVAEKLQKNLMQFTTNQANELERNIQLYALRNTIEHFDK